MTQYLTFTTQQTQKLDTIQ